MANYIVIDGDSNQHPFESWEEARDYFVTQRHAVIYQKQNEDYYLEIRRK